VGRYFVLLGRSASESVLKTVDFNWGAVYWVPGTGKSAVPIKHPGWYLRGKRGYVPFAIEELNSALKEMRKKDKLGVRS
jgi:hypothetical protein